MSNLWSKITRVKPHLFPALKSALIFFMGDTATAGVRCKYSPVAPSYIAEIAGIDAYLKKPIKVNR